MGSIPWTSGFTGGGTAPTIRCRWLRASWWCASDAALLDGERELRTEREPAQAGGDGPRLLRARGEAARSGLGPRRALPARGGRPARRARSPRHDRSRGAGGIGAGYAVRRLRGGG